MQVGQEFESRKAREVKGWGLVHRDEVGEVGTVRVLWVLRGMTNSLLFTLEAPRGRAGSFGLGSTKTGFAFQEARLPGRGCVVGSEARSVGPGEEGVGSAWTPPMTCYWLSFPVSTGAVLWPLSHRTHGHNVSN